MEIRGSNVVAIGADGARKHWEGDAIVAVDQGMLMIRTDTEALLVADGRWESVHLEPPRTEASRDTEEKTDVESVPPARSSWTDEEIVEFVCEFFAHCVATNVQPWEGQYGTWQSTDRNDAPPSWLVRAYGRRVGSLGWDDLITRIAASRFIPQFQRGEPRGHHYAMQPQASS